MSGYGYGEAKRSRHDRSRSRSPRPTDKRKDLKDHKDKKDKKSKKREADEPTSRRRESDADVHRTSSKGHASRKGDRDDKHERRSDRGDRNDRDKDKEKPDDRHEKRVERTEERLVDTPSQRGAWREQISKDEEDETMTGIAPMETDEEVDRKLAESRARREALIAKWVTRGEDKATAANDAPLVEADSASEDLEDCKDEATPEERAPEDAETIQEKKAINRFILNQKAEHDDKGDMFGENADKALTEKLNVSDNIGQTGASADDWDDSEGYYRAKIGELIKERYLVVEDTCGKGVFSNVVKCKDQKDGEMVAIKVMRCNDMMKKAAEKEVEVLERIAKADKGNKKHVIRLFRHFMYRGHLCLVFECMWDNLRVALKKYTKDKGMSLQAVRAYTKQLLIGIRHVHRCHVIHADIKPDNILISAGHNMVKICDLGSAIEMNEVEITPYLVSRFYRAPEIILGKEYGPPCDIFALGCTFYEIFTGKILFPGKSNNDMLRLFMEVKGKIPHRAIKSGQLWKQHFDDNLDFKFQDVDKLTQKKVVRTVTNLSAKRPIVDMIMSRVGPEKQKSDNPEDVLYVKKAKQFADLLNQVTNMDPDKRAAAQDLLEHPFLAEAGPGSKPPPAIPKAPAVAAKDGKQPVHLAPEKSEKKK